MEKQDKVITEEHHRRPRSLGGGDNPSNISYVRPTAHRHWHTLFGNMNAFQIAETINNGYYIAEGYYLEAVFINGKEVKGVGEHGSRKRKKLENAWRGLFGGMEFSEVIGYINNVWLDPSYHLYLREKTEEKP